MKPKNITNTIASVLWGMCTLIYLSGCTKFQEVTIEEPELNIPDTVYVYLDCSASMAGFFRTEEKPKASRLLGNLYAELTSRDIKVVFQKFDSEFSVIAPDYSSFGKSLLIDSFYICPNNRFSAPFKQIVQKQKHSPTSIHLVISDAVTSVESINAEDADLRAVIADYTKNPSNSIGLFHYFLNFKGRYYPQPNPTTVKKTHRCKGAEYANIVTKKRNLYLISFNHNSYNGFLSNILAERNKADHYQHFTYPYQDLVLIEHCCSPAIVSEQKVALLIDISKIPLTPNEKELRKWLTVIDSQGNIFDRAQLTIESTAQPNKYKCLIDFSKTIAGVPSSFELRFNKKVSLNAVWKDSLDYDVAEEPCNANLIDHSKTYRLHVLTDILGYSFQDRYVFQKKITVNTYNKVGFLPWLYAPVLGIRADIVWVDKVYPKITIAIVTIPLAIALFFYLGGLFDDSLNQMRIWVLLLLLCFTIAGIVCFMLIITTNFISCSDGPTWFEVASHTLLCGLYSSIIFFLASLGMKNLNNKLTEVPIKIF